jgi:hypothetical protein
MYRLAFIAIVARVQPVVGFALREFEIFMAEDYVSVPPNQFRH